jgi:preprotein translocase subunit SecY
MIDALRNSFRLPDLRNKLLYTLLILMIYQFAAHVPVPGVNRDALTNLFNSPGAGLVNVMNLLSGGAVSNFSVIANGVYPFITAQIILQLLTPIIPQLEALSREPGGAEKINGQYTYYLAIPMAALQAWGQINIFRSLAGGQPIIAGFGTDAFVTVSTIVTMTAGTMFAIWLGDLITEQGIGQGLSIIIFSGIVARTPYNVGRLILNSPNALFNITVFIGITLATVLVIVLVQEGQRRIPVQYGKRVRGRKVYGGGSTHIPMRVNTAGMIPLIFAQSFMAFPAIIASLFPAGPVGDSIRTTFGNQTGLTYWTLYFLLVVGFTYFYTDVMVQNQNLGDNLQRQGGFIPGIRPGKRTQDYITGVVRRITLVGALFLGAVAVLPGVVQVMNNVLFPGSVAGRTTNPAAVISGAGLIIVVGVVVDTMRQLEAQLVMRNYDSFMR